MKRTKYVVWLPGGEVARFSNPKHALDYGREASRSDRAIYSGPGLIEIGAPDGIIGQFSDGQASREFAHLDWR